MIYSYKEILNKYDDDYSIRKALEKKEIYKIEKGYYSDNPFVNPLILYSKKYPNAIITMDTAFYYYNLTDVIPDKVYLATDRDATKIHNEGIIQIFTQKELLNIGKIEMEIENEKVWIYDKERLLIELIRRRKQIPFDYYKEIILNYRYIVNDLDMYKIEEYLNYFKNDANIFDVMQKEVF